MSNALSALSVRLEYSSQAGANWLVAGTPIRAELPQLVPLDVGLGVRSALITTCRSRTIAITRRLKISTIGANLFDVAVGLGTIST